MTIICPACLGVLGQGSELEAEVLSKEHQSRCLATDEERISALAKVRFELMTKDLNL